MYDYKRIKEKVEGLLFKDSEISFALGCRNMDYVNSDGLLYRASIFPDALMQRMFYPQEHRHGLERK